MKRKKDAGNAATQRVPPIVISVRRTKVGWQVSFSRGARRVQKLGTFGSGVEAALAMLDYLRLQAPTMARQRPS